MALSTTFINMNNTPNIFVYHDRKPWGGFSLSGLLEDVRVQNINLTSGSSFDTATLVISKRIFGDNENYFMPIKIVMVVGTGINAFQKVLFRGFTTNNDSSIDSTREVLTLQCKDYKWLLSRRSIIRGKYYLIDGALSVEELGSGLSGGNAKFKFEKYRADINDKSGFIQHQECVFNRGGLPDCFINNNTSSVLPAFFLDTIEHNELLGVRTNHHLAKNHNGFYWTFATILRHIEKFWIEPYNATTAKIEISPSDLTKIKQINDDINKPMDFSIEGYNPLTAIDFVVRSLPGKWNWFLDYSGSNMKIRIKEIDDFNNGNIALNIGDETKLATNPIHISNATVNRDGSNASKFAIAKGGKIKITCTVKLIPLWQRFVNGTQEFKDEADFIKYRFWLSDILGDSKENLNALLRKLTKEEVERYKRVLRYYGVAEEGIKFAAQIVSVNPSVTTDDILLTGNIGEEYSEFTKDIRDMFFENARIEREISPPEFARFGKKIPIFIFDELHNNVPTDKFGQDINHELRKKPTDPLPTTAEINRDKNRSQWIIPDEINKLTYKLDEKNGTVLFDLPQFKMRTSIMNTDPIKVPQALFDFSSDGLDHLDQDSVLKATTKVEPRDIYMTATFTTDLSALFGRKTDNRIVDIFSGAPFSTYINNNSSDVVFHKNAWYPVTNDNKDQTDPDFSNDVMDGHTIGDKIRRDEDFDNYKSYIGQGGRELMRSLIGYLKGYNRFEENVNITLPYIEVGYKIGDKLKKIGNSNFFNLNTYLLGISFSQIGDSDSYQTIYNFRNFYGSDKSNVSYVSNRNINRELMFNDRTPFKFVNEIEGGDLPQSSI